MTEGGAWNHPMAGIFLLLIVLGLLGLLLWLVGFDRSWLRTAVGWLESAAWAVFGFLVTSLFALAEDIGLL